MARRGKGPCGCFGITLERGSQLFAVFDIATGGVIFVLFLAILLIGESGGFYPSEKFNIPRQVVITFVFLGYYNATTGLLLYFAAGLRKRAVCFVWMLLNAPLMLVDFLKIYEIVVVYKLSKEIKHGTIQNIKDSDDDEESDGAKAKEKSGSK